MARLRVYNENGGNIYDIMSLRKEEKNKEQRILKLEKRIIKKKLKTSLETLDNIPAINDGKRTWQREYFKSLRGA